MSAFEFQALDTRGRAQKGILEGDTPRQVRAQLRERGLTPVQVVEVHGRAARKATATGEAVKSTTPRGFGFKRGLSAGVLALLTRQLATLVRSALPLEEALYAVGQQTEQPRAKSLIMAVRSRVLEGHSLATGLAEYPHVFPDYYRATVTAGEQSGRLDTVLERVADYTESRQALRSKFQLALLYPVMITIVAILVVTLLLAYVVPKVVEVFEGIGQQLPIITRALIATSDFVRDYGGYMLLALVIAGVAFRFAMRRDAFKRRFHRFLLRVPLIGKLLRGLNAARFARTFSILMASGVPVIEGLRIAADVVTNLPMRDAVQDAAVKVREGASLHAALQRSGLFPPMTLHLIASGESSGNLESMLERASINQERELETTISVLLGVFEPMMILIMGGIVLLIVIAILLPIFDLNQLVR